MLAGKKSADSQLAGNFPTNVAGKWNFSYHPAGSAEQIFFSQQQKKIVKKALKAFTYHFYGLFVTFCENVSLGAPVTLTAVYMLYNKAKLKIYSNIHVPVVMTDALSFFCCSARC